MKDLKERVQISEVGLTIDLYSGEQVRAFWHNNSIVILKICKPMQTSPLHVTVVTVVCLGQQPYLPITILVYF